jgi:hypothetical protein
MNAVTKPVGYVTDDYPAMTGIYESFTCAKCAAGYGVIVGTPVYTTDEWVCGECGGQF